MSGQYESFFKMLFSGIALAELLIYCPLDRTPEEKPHLNI